MTAPRPSPGPRASAERSLALRRILGAGRYDKMRFVWRDWLARYLPRYLRRRGEIRDGMRGRLEDLFIFLTNACNARCKHCFYIEELGYVPGEMKLDEYRRLAPTLPRLERLVFTGGEAILHPDCGDIVSVLARATQADRVTIITNGFLPEKIRRLCEKWTSGPDAVPGVVDILVSLDGMEETHNEIRGNPRAWTLANETLATLCDLRRSVPGRLDVGVVTIITDRNSDQLEALNDHLRCHEGVRHGFEFIRGTNFSLWNLPREFATDYNPKGVGMPPPEEWDRVLETLQRINRRNGIANHAFHITAAFTIEMMRTGKKMVDCVSAGQNVGVLYATGEVAVCEFSKAFGNVRQFGLDFARAWDSPQADAMRRATSRCWCTHGCYLSKNIEYSRAGMTAMLRQL